MVAPGMASGRRPLAIITFSEDPPLEVLERVIAEVESSVKKAVRTSSKHSSRGGLADSIKVYQALQGIVIDSDKEYARLVNEGHGEHVMYNLIGKVVPLKLTSGVTIFRRVTLEAIQRGRWRSPGRAGKDFVRRGVQDAVAKSGGLMTRYGYDLDEDVEEYFL